MGVGSLPKAAYATRRETLMKRFKGVEGVIFLEGARSIERNPQVPHPFMQNPHVQYLTGLSIPNISILLDPREQTYTLFAPEHTVEDEVWHGKELSHAELLELSGADNIRLPSQVTDVLKQFDDVPVHSLPKHKGPAHPIRYAHLRNSLVEERLVKSPAEIEEIESALAITAEAYKLAMAATRPGKREGDVRALIGLIYQDARAIEAFKPILTIQGAVLHAKDSDNELRAGEMFLMDSGAQREYAADITRAWPVNGRFTEDQLAIYNIVRAAKTEAIAMMAPGVNFRDVHLHAEDVIIEGLRNYGILRGDPQEIKENGAHRLFFPHGLGHAMGLDVHDCGDFEDAIAGYNPRNPRSKLFGLKFLRFARDLAPGHVMTVEPGIYFIPALLDNLGKHSRYVDAEKAKRLVRTVSGIRLEDDVLITTTGNRVLGPGIPEEPEDLEMIVGDEQVAREMLLRKV